MFAAEVDRAMSLGVRVILAHEMPGIGGQEARHGAEFVTFFACEHGATPPVLLRQNIYATIAVPLKGSAWRQVSMVLLARELAQPPPKRKDEAERTAASRHSDVLQMVATRAATTRLSNGISEGSCRDSTALPSQRTTDCSITSSPISGTSMPSKLLEPDAVLDPKTHRRSHLERMSMSDKGVVTTRGTRHELLLTGRSRWPGAEGPMLTDRVRNGSVETPMSSRIRCGSVANSSKGSDGIANVQVDDGNLLLMREGQLTRRSANVAAPSVPDANPAPADATQRGGLLVDPPSQLSCAVRTLATHTSRLPHAVALPSPGSIAFPVLDESVREGCGVRARTGDRRSSHCGAQPNACRDTYTYGQFVVSDSSSGHTLYRTLPSPRVSQNGPVAEAVRRASIAEDFHLSDAEPAAAGIESAAANEAVHA